MKHIAIDFDNALPVENFQYLAPSREPHIEERVCAKPCMNSMQDRIAIFKNQLASQRGNLNVWLKCAMFVVQHDPPGLNGYAPIERAHRNNRIADATSGIDQQCFVRDGSTAKMAAFDHLERRRAIVFA